MSRFEFISRSPVSCVKSVAVIGCGATALYFLKHIVDNGSYGLALTFFSAPSSPGAGIPNDAERVGMEALANIACADVPDLPVAPEEWFASQSDRWLDEQQIERQLIEPGFIPTHQALEKYFEAQFQSLLHSAANIGLSVRSLRQTTVTDMQATDRGVMLTFYGSASDEGNIIDFDYAVIATGHPCPPAPQWSAHQASSRWMAAVSASYL